MSSKNTTKTFFTTGEVARILGVATMTVIKYCKRGELAVQQSKLTGYRRIPREAVVDFMKKRSIPLERLDTVEPLRILIADDEEDVRYTIRQAIKKLLPEATIAEAADGYTACLMAGSLAPHLVTLDLHMPQMDGFQVCAAFRAVEATRDTRILVVTTYGSRENEEAVRRLGADDLLAKPFSVTDLTAKVRALLGLEARAAVR
jgi:excisionase family DNA binding protein